VAGLKIMISLFFEMTFYFGLDLLSSCSAVGDFYKCQTTIIERKRMIVVDLTSKVLVEDVLQRSGLERPS
jgi:hypothetical protein